MSKNCKWGHCLSACLSALFESDVADTEIGLTVGKVYKLLGRRVVGLGLVPLGTMLTTVK